MINDLIKNITDYIDYLRTNLSLQVSFCNSTNQFINYMHLLYPYNAHINEYCVHLKSNPEILAECRKRQLKVTKKSEDGAFYGTCWAGVEEYVFPIMCEGESIGFISVSGFRGKLKKSYSKVKEVAKKFNIDYKTLERKYYTLSLTPPPLEWVKTLINPLCIMFITLYEKMPKTTLEGQELSLYVEILSFLSYGYSQQITLDDIALKTHYSKSYIRKVFKKSNGLTVHKYLTILRIKRAKELLLSTRLAINKIALDVGFVDANYFTNAFKKEVGVTPKEFRKKGVNIG